MKPLLTILLAVLVFHVAWGASSPSNAVDHYVVYNSSRGNTVTTKKLGCNIAGNVGDVAFCKVYWKDGNKPLTSNKIYLR
jgi:hypothetical protein